MASANVELVRSIYAAWGRGDFSSAEWAHPEIEFAIPAGLLTGSWTGLAGMAQAMRELLSAWDKLRIQADEYRELDSERVLVLGHWTAHGKASGLEIAQVGTELAHLFHCRDGKVTRLVAYWDRKRALADLGLARENGSPRS